MPTWWQNKERVHTMQENYQEHGPDLALQQNMQLDSDGAHAIRKHPMNAQRCSGIAAKQQAVELTGDDTSTLTSSAASPMAL